MDPFSGDVEDKSSNTPACKRLDRSLENDL